MSVMWNRSPSREQLPSPHERRKAGRALPCIWGQNLGRCTSLRMVSMMPPHCAAIERVVCAHVCSPTLQVALGYSGSTSFSCGVVSQSLSITSSRTFSALGDWPASLEQAAGVKCVRPAMHARMAHEA